MGSGGEEGPSRRTRIWEVFTEHLLGLWLGPVKSFVSTGWEHKGSNFTSSQSGPDAIAAYFFMIPTLIFQSFRSHCREANEVFLLIPFVSYPRPPSNLDSFCCRPFRLDLWGELCPHSPGHPAPHYALLCLLQEALARQTKLSSATHDQLAVALTFFPVLSSYSWHTSLGRFKAFSLTVWFTYIVKCLPQ